MEPTSRVPYTFCPSAWALRFLVSEAPRFDLLFDEFRWGRATARELCAVLWPGVDPDARDGWLKCSPVRYITEILMLEATPCSLGGSGTIRRDGEDFIADEPSGGRPAYLPRWPKSMRN